MIAVTIEAVHVDGDFNKRVRGAARGVADGDAPVVLLLSNFGGLLYGLTTAASGRCRNDVVCMVAVTCEPVKVDSDLDIRIRLAARRVADGDLFLRFNLLLDHFSFFCCVLHRSCVAATNWGRNDVVTVVAVTVETVKVDRDLNVRIRGALGGVAERDLLSLRHGGSRRKRRRSPWAASSDCR